MRSYIKHFVLAGLLTGALIVTLNWTMDPYNIFDGPHIEGINTQKPVIKENERIYKTVRLANQTADVVLLGTSRADNGLDPLHPVFAGRRAVNLALPSQPYSESRLLFDRMTRTKPVTVVFGIDFFPANAYFNAPPDFVLDNYSPYRKLELLTNIATTRNSLKTLFDQSEPSVSWTGDGHIVRTSRAINPAKDFREGLAIGTYLPEPQCDFVFKSGSNQPLEDVRSIFSRAYQENIDLRVFISPSHAWQWETIAAAGLWNRWEEWKRRLVNLNESEAVKTGHPPFPIWDFSGYNSVTTEPVHHLKDTVNGMQYYFDASHYSPEAGNLVLDKIFNYRDPSRKAPDDFGVRLTVSNIETELARIRSERQLYRRSRTGEAAELAAMAKVAASHMTCRIQQ